ncbi:MAG: hypothetical protein J6K24_00325 [Tidjanibacter sp.]|nr:hypothetical protein [Tidjanibacter sp.]
MASLRQIKKQIDYVVNEVVYDCYLSLGFHADKQEEIVALMQQVVDMRNNLMELVNNPAEPHNPSLVRKHYAYVRAQLVERTEEIWGKLSEICKFE